MMRIENGEIIPGIGIGDYKIGMKKIYVKKIIGKDFSERRQQMGGSVITIENAMIWFNSKGLIWQIGVTKGFKGTYCKNIAIGMTLEEITKIYGKYECVQDTYNIAGIEGMCFELEDIDEWDELKAPIEWIYVYEV